MRSLSELTREHRLERIIDEALREVKLASLKLAEKELMPNEEERRQAREIFRRSFID